MPGATPSSSAQPAQKPSPSGAGPSTTTLAPSAAALATYDRTRSRCAAVISGPIIEASSPPGPTTTDGMRSPIASTSLSPTAPTATTTETAMQRSPADP
jgi:hypothetical protein